MGGASPGRRAAWLTLLSVVLLVGLRALQCSSLGPLMYSPEWAQFGNLAADLQAGALDPRLSFRDFYRIYAYGDHAQGTLLISLFAVPLSWVFGPTSTAVHGVAIGFEAVLVGLLAHVLARRGVLAWALGTAALLLPPLFVTVFQLMPYGNHTEFLWMPVLMALVAAERPTGRRLTALTVLAALSVLFYRLNLAAVLALAGAALLGRADGSRRTAGFLVGGALGGLALATWVSGDGGGITYLPAAGFRGHELTLTLGKVLRDTWPGAGAGGWVGPATLVAGLGLLGAGVLSLAADRRGAWPWFGLLWFALAFGAPVISAAPSPEYLISAWYACLLTGLIALAGPSPAARRLAAAALGLLVLVAAPGDLRVALAPAGGEYDGVALNRRLALQTIDADDLPYWMALAESGRAGRAVGSVTKIGACSRQFARELGFDGRDLQASRCGQCSKEGVAKLVVDEAQASPEFDADALGRALWIRCDRDLAEVRATLHATGIDGLGGLLRAAEDEARVQGDG